MATWYLCLTPDWRRRTKAAFSVNPPDKPYYQFWYNQASGAVFDPNQPPSIANTDSVGLAIEVLLDDSNQPRYAVKAINGGASVNPHPKGNGAVPAGQATAFQQNGTPTASISTTAPATLTIPDSDGGSNRTYSVLNAVYLFRPGTHKREAYEIGVLTTLQDPQQDTYNFLSDPEMDVDT